MEGIRVLFSNFSFWDGLIFFVVLVEVVVLIYYFRSVKKLEKALDPAKCTGCMSKKAQMEKEEQQRKEHKVKESLERAIKVSYFYDDIVSLFTIFGILGTVMALLPMVGTENMQSNFTVALTTTAWGIIFSIIFKILGVPVSASLDICHEDANKYLEREYIHDEMSNR